MTRVDPFEPTGLHIPQRDGFVVASGYKEFPVRRKGKRPDQVGVPRKNRRADPGDYINNNDVTRVQANCDQVFSASENLRSVVEGNCAKALSPPFWEPFDDLDLLQGLSAVAHANPRRRRGKGESVMVYLRRSVTDHISVPHDKTLNIICPPAG